MATAVPGYSRQLLRAEPLHRDSKHPEDFGQGFLPAKLGNRRPEEWPRGWEEVTWNRLRTEGMQVSEVPDSSDSILG